MVRIKPGSPESDFQSTIPERKILVNLLVLSFMSLHFLCKPAGTLPIIVRSPDDLSSRKRDGLAISADGCVAMETKNDIPVFLISLPRFIRPVEKAAF